MEKNVDGLVQGFISKRWRRQIACLEKKEGVNFLALGIALMHQYKDSRSTLKRAKKINYSRQ